MVKVWWDGKEGVCQLDVMVREWWDYKRTGEGDEWDGEEMGGW
jgi:hypothetical protein